MKTHNKSKRNIDIHAGLLHSLESEAIYVLREIASEFKNVALLFSGGKDSTVLLHLARRAFAGGPIPFSVLHIDTGHNYKEVIKFRDAEVKKDNSKLIVRSVEDSIARGRVSLLKKNESRNAAQSVTLLDAISEFGFDALIGGARRDEEKARAKERIFSHRNTFGEWNPKLQRPEPWNIFNTRIKSGEHFRVFPLSNWTEVDVWRYISKEKIDLPSLYYAHKRKVVRRGDKIVPITELTPAMKGEEVLTLSVRFRTVGDITCTCPIESNAINPLQIIEETLVSSVSERGATRMDDATDDASMEIRKKGGYF